MPATSSSIVVVLALLLPAGARGYDCSGDFIDLDNGALVIPSDWTTVRDSAFAGCGLLKSVSFSNSSVTLVDDHAFEGCTALESVSFNNSRVTTVRSSAFYLCSALESVSFSNSRVTVVGDFAFYGCDALESVSFSNSSVTTVGDYAFTGCDALATVLYGDNNNQSIDVHPNAFANDFPLSGCRSHSNFSDSNFMPPGACKCVPFTAANRSAACHLEFGVSPAPGRAQQAQMQDDVAESVSSGFTTGHTEIIPGFNLSEATLADLFENARSGLGFDGTDLVAFGVVSNYAAGDPNFGNLSGVSLGDALFVSSTGTVSLKMDNPGNHTVQLIARTGHGAPAYTQPVVVLDWTVQVEPPGIFGLRQDGPKECGQGYMNKLQYNIAEVLRKRAPGDHRHDVNTTIVLPGINISRCNFSAIFVHAATDVTTNTPQISFGVVVEDWDTDTAADLGEAPFYTDTGRVLLALNREGKFRVRLQAFTVRSDGRKTLNLTEMTLDVRLPDTYDKATRQKRGCSGHGVVTEDVDGGGHPMLQNDVYNCGCTGTWMGHDCDTAVAPDHVEDSAETAEIVGGVSLPVLAALVIALVAPRVKRQQAVAAGKRRLALICASTNIQAPADALFSALALGSEDLVGDLLEHGADATARDQETQQLAHTVVLARQTPDPALLLVLFRAHCAIDAQIGLLLRRPDKLAGLRQALLALAREQWRSPEGAATVLHAVVDSCRLQCLDDATATHLASALLAEDPQLLTAVDGRSRTVATMAAECDGAVELERLLTVVVFGRYQLLRAENHLHRSSTSVVAVCRDLNSAVANPSASSAAPAPLVLKMIRDEGSWARELHSRGALQGAVDVATTTVPVLSAAVICTEHDDGLEQTIAGVAIHRCPNTALRNARHGLASDMMSQYPFAICMPLAERNLLEIIQSERASGQPIGVLAYTARKIALTIKALHDSGVVHADLKPRNIVRTGGHAYRLIDFDMSFSIHETAGDGSGRGPAGSLPTVHASATKIGASNAYAAPELVQWAVAAAGCGDTAAAGRTAIRSLGTPAQVDILSFGMTLYELITGVPLHAHAYDRLTARALQMVLTDWQGLDENAADQLKALHPGQDLTPTIDLLRWMLDVDPMNRPDSMAQVLAHTFFDPQGGTMREHFLVEQIRAKLEDMDVVRDCPKIMISYCWDDTNFVLGKLGMALAGRVRGLWLDRLGGDQGMGAWARASMDRGVAGADVVIAVLSRKYTQSENCGFEMELADLHDKEVIPVVLGLPFDDWCDLKKVGKTELKTQFHDAETGDGKLFVDFTKPELFETKLNQELLPRLTAKHRQLQSARIGMFEQRWQQQALSSSLGRDTSVGVPPARSNTSAWASSLLGPEAKTRSVSWTSPSTGPTSSQSVSASIGITFGNHANPVFDWQGMSAGASPAPRAGANATSDDAPDPAEIAWTLSGLGEHSSSPA